MRRGPRIGSETEGSVGMSIQQGTDVKTAVRAAEAKYLTFVLAGEVYGVEVLKVREIIGMMQITAIPRLPDFVRGVMNLRGKVIPVIDLRLKLGMDVGEVTESTCIIVVDISGVETGIVVDEVHEVQNIASEDVEDPPSFGVDVNTEFILGIAKASDKVMILLDIGKVLTSEDILSLSHLS